MELVSQCALRVAKVVWQPGHGGYALTVVCKATFELQPGVSALAAEQEAVVLADVYAGEGSALAVASDLVPAKKWPEVLLTGHAYAPEGRPASSVLARLVVGEIDKTIQVAGDRSFGRNGRISEAEPFTGMPLGWDRADGGPGTVNPAGRSLGSAARADALGRIPAPNLLPAGLRLRSRSDTVACVGFGPIAPLWPSRVACLGQYAGGWDPGRWQERALPSDFDYGYFNAAPLDQQRVTPFGEEVLYLENLHPRFAQLSTRLAPVVPGVTVEMGAGAQRVELRCDTLSIDTDRGLAMLVWRGYLLLDHPERAGVVVVTGPGASQVAVPGWAAGGSAGRYDPEATLMPNAVGRLGAALPFARSAGGAVEKVEPVRVAAVAPRVRGGDPEEVTLEPRFGPPEAAALPFDGARGERKFDLEGTVVPSVAAPAAAVLPFPRAGVVAPVRVAPVRVAPVVPRVRGGDPDEMTLEPRFSPPAAATLPFGGSQGESALGLPVGRGSEEKEDGPVTPRRGELPEEPWAQSLPAMGASWEMPPVSPEGWRAPEVEAAPLPVKEMPAPPALIGPIAVVVKEEVGAARESGVAAVVEATAPEVEIDFDAYPAQRCGGIAARLACAGGEEGKVGEILRGEDLDGGRWERVHAHWLERIREEAARSRKALLSEYDGGYVVALEKERGVIGVEEYARLAEAAERGEVGGALAELGLPAGAWGRIHRVWIGRMVKEVRLGKQVRGAIEVRRAAGDARSAARGAQGLRPS